MEGEAELPKEVMRVNAVLPFPGSILWFSDSCVLPFGDITLCKSLIPHVYTSGKMLSYPLKPSLQSDLQNSL